MYCWIWQPYPEDIWQCVETWLSHLGLLLAGDRRGQGCCSTSCNSRMASPQRIQPTVALLLRLRSLCAGRCPEGSPSVSFFTRGTGSPQRGQDSNPAVSGPGGWLHDPDSPRAVLRSHELQQSPWKRLGLGVCRGRK